MIRRKPGRTHVAKGGRGKSATPSRNVARGFRRISRPNLRDLEVGQAVLIKTDAARRGLAAALLSGLLEGWWDGGA